MKNNNKLKDERLSMSHSTAAHRLRKSVLFKYVQKANEHFCYKCGAEIESIEDFSIEHKTPWLYSDDPLSLFMDLNNIAFSHLKCNNADSSPSRRKMSPEGYSWCSVCKQHKTLEKFASGPRWNGKMYRCQDCTNQKKREKRIASMV